MSGRYLLKCGSILRVRWNGSDEEQDEDENGGFKVKRGKRRDVKLGILFLSRHHHHISRKRENGRK